MTQNSVYSFDVKTIDGRTVSMSEFQGKVLLIVNVASKCGLTPQYEGLEKLFKKYGKDGLVVLGFPCNQFLKQEPGTEQEIQNFCSTNYDVTFPMFAKVDVNGANTHPLFAYLKKEKRGFLGTQAIKWNFNKFLVDRRGKALKRFSPKTVPADLEQEVAAALTAKA